MVLKKLITGYLFILIAFLFIGSSPVQAMPFSGQIHPSISNKSVQIAGSALSQEGSMTVSRSVNFTNRDLEWIAVEENETDEKLTLRNLAVNHDINVAAFFRDLKYSLFQKQRITAFIDLLNKTSFVNWNILFRVFRI